MSDGAVKRKSSTSSASSAIPFHFLAGLGSGIFSAFLLQPADLLKTRVQQANTPSSSSLRFALRQVLNGPHPLRALWRGTTPSVIRTGFGSAMYFGMLNQMRQYAAKIPPVAGPGGGGGGAGGTSDGKKSSSSSALPKLGNTANLTTGALARVAAGFILNPVTVLKVRYESSQFAYTSLTGAARDILRKEGPRGFFAGFGVTAARDAPYAGLYVLLYEQAKARLGGLAVASSTQRGMAGGDGRGLDDRKSSTAATTMSSSVSINFVSGAFAATAATAITNPFDAVKTRLQLAPAKYRNMLQTARMMLGDEGVKSMFSGLSLRVGRKAVSSALTWTVYEEVIRRVERAFV